MINVRMQTTQRTSIVLILKLSKELLNNNSPDFAWEVMLLEINVESSCPSIDDVMKLIQLYMVRIN